MNDKTEFLGSISRALESGLVTEHDLRSLLKDREASAPEPSESPGSSAHLSAVDVMFYIAGIVLFAALAVFIAQLWDGGPVVRILLSAGLGALLWAYAYYMINLPNQNDLRRGMTNATLLTGSLLVVAGGFITMNEITVLDEINFYASATTLFLLGLIHIGFALRIRNDLILLSGIILSVAAFPTVAFGLLAEIGAPMYVWCLITATSGGLLAYATRVIGRMNPSRQHIKRSFDTFGTFIALMSFYVASFDDATGLLWLVVLVAGIIGLFYLSIVMQDKLMLGTGSLFLVLSIITISFRYFSGYGAATSLLISAIGLLATAVVATNINRRYLTTAPVPE